MGLYTTHGCWDGPYSSFSRWRNVLAELAEYQLMGPTQEEIDQGVAFPGQKYVMIEWSAISQGNVEGEWTRTPPDPLIVLLVHSDCDGVIHPAQARPLADRLEELLPKVEAFAADPENRAGWYPHRTRQFIEGLRAAADLEEDVEFH